mgnify:CR=1 FL=1
MKVAELFENDQPKLKNWEKKYDELVVKRNRTPEEDETFKAMKLVFSATAKIAGGKPAHGPALHIMRGNKALQLICRTSRLAVEMTRGSGERKVEYFFPNTGNGYIEAAEQFYRMSKDL